MAVDGVGQLTADGLGRERAVDDLPQRAVLGRIHVEHHLAQHGHVAGPLVAQEAGPAPGREVLRVSRHVADLGVAEHQPVAAPAAEGVRSRLVDPYDGVVTSQFAEQVVRDAVRVQGGGQDVAQCGGHLGAPRVGRRALTI